MTPTPDEPPQDPTPADVPAGEPAPEEEPAEEPLELLTPEELRGGLEALLFVMDDPVDEETLAAALRCTVEQVRTGLAELAAGYDERRSGLTLRRVGEGWRLYTREEHAPVVERYLIDGQRSRLTQAALETLAVIAYRQPVTRARVSAIRGVGVDGVMRTLLTRGLVHEVGLRPRQRRRALRDDAAVPGAAGAHSLAELPELAPFAAGDRGDARRAPRQLSRPLTVRRPRRGRRRRPRRRPPAAPVAPPAPGGRCPRTRSTGHPARPRPGRRSARGRAGRRGRR